MPNERDIASGASALPAAVGTVPPGAPSWVTAELIEQTLRVWQPYYQDPLIPEDAMEMIMAAGRMIDVLSCGGGHEAIRRPGAGQQS